MSISEKFKSLFSSAQEGARSTTVTVLTLGLRVITGFFLGLLFALIGQELVGFGTVTFIFVITIIFALFMKLSMPWRLATIMVFDLICVLVAQLLRMYILLAP